MFVPLSQFGGKRQPFRTGRGAGVPASRPSASLTTAIPEDLPPTPRTGVGATSIPASQMPKQGSQGLGWLGDMPEGGPHRLGQGARGLTPSSEPLCCSPPLPGQERDTRDWGRSMRDEGTTEQHEFPLWAPQLAPSLRGVSPQGVCGPAHVPMPSACLLGIPS